MRVTVIGMSGIGKSHWAAKIEEAGFRVFDCDAEIAARLDERLSGEGDVIARLAAWLGFPHQSGYGEREAEYLALENEIVAEALGLLAIGDESLIIDATGSVIYVEDELFDRLRKASVFVHLAAPLSIQQRMCSEYLAHPRPILWRDHFRQEVGESGEQAIRHSYPRLLAAREKRYRQIADVTFAPDELRDPHFGVERFLERIRQASTFVAPGSPLMELFRP